MSKFSVKKPFTVLVGVILVLVLGIVSFSKMTTDLLPNMDMPYVVVYTASPGSTPESVEKSVSKPLESVLGSTTGIKSINSVSSENISMIMMEFAQETDMNAVSIEISNTIDQVKGALPETCSTPIMMQISPDMMPIMVASVDVEDMELEEVSDYVNDSLLHRFERLNGVASVNTTGSVSTKVKVLLDQKKIDALNDKVLASVDNDLAKAKRELDQGQAELNSAKKKLDSGKKGMNHQISTLTDQLSQASAQIDGANAQLSAILSEETTLNASMQAFQTELEQLQKISGKNNQIHALAVMIVAYDFTGSVPQVHFPPTKEEIESISNNSLDFLKALEDPAKYIGQMSDEAFQQAMSAVMKVLPDLLPGDADLSELEHVSRKDFAALATTAAYASKRVEEIDTELHNINTRMMTIQAMKPQLEEQLKKAQDAYAKLEASKIEATLGFAEGSTQLTVGKSSLENAQVQLDQAMKQFEDARDAAYKKADVSGIITAEMISNVLVAENFEMPAGYIKDKSDRSYVLKIGKTIDSVDELSNLILFHMDMDGVGDIRLSDVASVKYASESENAGYAKVNGNDAVVLSFSKQSTASTSEVADAINAEIKAITEENPDVHITPLMDQGDYIHLIVKNVLSNLILGGILAVLVLLLFLRDVRPTIIIAFSIPLSVLFAIVLMYFSGMTLNLISLSGLALGVGMLVDNSIVVIENIYRLRSLGMSKVKAAVHGARQVSGAIFASTLTTICVFLPIVFTEGISRQIFTDMGLTIAYSLSASLIVALTVVPAMSSTMLKKEVQKTHSRFSGLMGKYESLLRWCLNHRAGTMAGVIALFLFACVMTTRMGMTFIPKMSSNQMSATLTMPEGTDEVTAQAVYDKTMSAMQDVEGVQTVGAMSGGSGMMSGSNSGESASFYILLEDHADNSEVSAQIMKKTDGLPGELSVSESTMDMSAVAGSGLQIDVYGDDLDELQSTCASLAKKLESIEGLEEISDGNEDADLQKVITINKEAAMREGLTVAQVYTSLAEDLTNEVSSTTLTVGQDELPVVVVKPVAVTAENLMKQTVTTTDMTTGENKEVALNSIASQSESRAPASINRDNNERIMRVTAAVDDDHNIALVSRDVQHMLDDFDLPAGMHAEITGENETIQDAMKDLLLMLLLAVIFIYLIMVAQFQSLLSPFIVMFTMPLAFTGGLLALLITGQDLSVLAMLGFIILAGVVVNNGIVFVSCVNDLRMEGMDKREALVEAGKMRIRPIFMTALTTILAMSTMAMGLGTGGEIGQSMAIVVIGGLTYATVLTLIVVPIIYDVFHRREKLRIIEIKEDELSE